MEEKDLLQQILSSTEDIEVPESLLPENIEKKLTPKTISFTKKVTRYSELAAAVCILIVGGYTIQQNKKTESSKSAAVSEVADSVMEEIETEAVMKGIIAGNANMEKAEDSRTNAMEEQPAAMYEDIILEDSFMEEQEEMEEYESMADTAGITDQIVSEGGYRYEIEEQKRVLVTEAGNEKKQIAVIEPEDEMKAITGIYIQDQVLHLVIEQEDGKEDELWYDISDPEKPEHINELYCK